MDEIRRSTTCPRSGRSVKAPVAAAVALTVLVALGAAARALPPASVDIQDSKYLAPALTVPAGTTDPVDLSMLEAAEKLPEFRRVRVSGRYIHERSAYVGPRPKR